MCGIAGFAGLRDPELLRRMTASLLHRGPDEEGYHEAEGVGLGVRRLSIVDLETGRQPIAGEDGRVVVAFNGEIYNHKELRKELEAAGHRFRTRSDTEVIAHLFEDRGREALLALRGMFALAVWDARDRSLTLARDRLGIKPLHYAERGGRLWFGSELRALRAVPGLGAEPDLESVRQAADLLYVPAPFTILKDVRKLEPGSWLRWKGGVVELGRYWSPPAETSPMEEEEAAAELERLLRLSLAEQREADVPVGLFLSGGLDSSLLAAYLAEGGAPPRAYVLRPGHAGFDESEKAREAAERLGVAIEVVEPDPALGPLAWARRLDEPLADSSALATWWVSAACRGKVKAAMTGIGGDELFGGYPRYAGARAHAGYSRLPAPLREALAAPAAWVPDTAGSRNVGSWVRRFLEGGRRPLAEAYRGWVGHAPPELFAPGLGGERPDPVLASFAAGEGLDPARRAMRSDLASYLPDDLLALADRASMAASLELRVPLLDERIVEFACRLPTRLRLRGRTLKVLPRRLLSRFLPRSFTGQAKRGFMVPMSDWLRTSLREPLLDLLSPAAVRRRGWFRPEAVAGLLQEHLAGRRDRPDLLWALLQLELWARGGEPPESPRVEARPRALELLSLSDLHFGDEEGGAGRVALETAKDLARRGHRVHCWSPSRRPGRESAGGLTLHRAPGVGLSGLPAARAHLAALARELKPDALIVHQPRASALARGLWPAAPRLYFFHSCWSREYRADRGGRLGAAAREALERAELGSAAAAVALSRHMEAELLAHGLERAKLSRVPPGVDLERFTIGPEPRGRRLLTVRNLRRRMGLEGLLEAFAALKAEDPELGLDIVGTGPLEGELKARAAALGLTDARFLGRVPDAELPGRYRAAALFVLPSRELEGLGLVLLEALACGLPAVGTPVGGIPEVLAPLEPGWLSAGTSPAQLAEALRRGLAAAGEPGTRARCRAYAEGFPWSRTGAALEEILHGLL